MKEFFNNLLGQIGSFYVYNESYGTISNVTVYFNLSGTATNGVDYAKVTNSIVITNGVGYDYVYIDPTNDGLKPNQSIILTLTQNPDYLIDPDNDFASNVLTAEPQVYPTVNGDSVNICPEITNDVTMQAQDPRGLTMTYTILTWPTHGKLYTNGTANCTYTPTNCFGGQDSFTYMVNDGQYNSGSATVTLIVNDTVYASSISAQTCRGTPVPVTLSGGDYGCGLAMNYAVLSNPNDGSLSGTPPNITYTPTGTNFTGSDSFNFIAYNECGNAATNSVNITIGDDAIYPNSQNILTETNHSVAITLSALSGDTCKADTNDYVYTVTSEPTHGILSGSGANLTYTPTHNFEGMDSFQFTAMDGTNFVSAPATIYVFVIAGPILSTECDPFGTAIQLNWSLDTNVTTVWQTGLLDINDFVVYRSTNSGVTYTAITTNFNSSSWMTYLDTNIMVGQSYYYKVNFESYGTVTNESPFSNIIETSSQNPDDLIPANAFWEVVTNLSSPTNVLRLQAPFSNLYPKQYLSLYPLPNTNWTTKNPTTTTTVWSNSITMFIPTNTPFAQVQWSVAIDNGCLVYVNGTYVGSKTNNANPAVWSPFQPFPENTLHYGTNNVDAVITDIGDINYFGMVVTTNTCGY